MKRFAIRFLARFAPTPALPMLLIGGMAVALAGCGTTAGGVRGEVAFHATGHLSNFRSARPPAEVAACFFARARLLPFSVITTDPVRGTPLYRLRYRDYWFETIAFQADAGGGTLVEVISSGNYDRGWTTMLVRDRLAPLGDCLAPVAVAGR